MSEYATTVKYGDKSYNVSVSGKDVYFSSEKKTGGLPGQTHDHISYSLIDSFTVSAERID
ncbi:MAG: hypothetical protein ACI9J4_001298 [Paraglaciecola sp.]|jgi:hypothetical protein